jgi:hypothetical protein
MQSLRTEPAAIFPKTPVRPPDRAAICPGLIRVGGERWSNGQAESSAALMTSLLKNGWS